MLLSFPSLDAVLPTDTEAPPEHVLEVGLARVRLAVLAVCQRRVPTPARRGETRTPTVRSPPGDDDRLAALQVHSGPLRLLVIRLVVPVILVFAILVVELVRVVVEFGFIVVLLFELVVCELLCGEEPPPPIPRPRIDIFVILGCAHWKLLVPPSTCLGAAATTTATRRATPCTPGAIMGLATSPLKRNDGGMPRPSQPAPVHVAEIRFPVEFWRRVRHRALDEGVPAAELVRRATRAFLADSQEEAEGPRRARIEAGR